MDRKYYTAEQILDALSEVGVGAGDISEVMSCLGRMPSAESDVPDTNVGDMISRQDAIDAMMQLQDEDIEAYGCEIPEGFDGDRAVMALRKLPSAEPRCIATIQLSQEQLDEAFEKVKADILSVKPKTGKWIGGELGNCSCCGHEGCASDIWDRCAHMYCPNCGSKLEV